MKRRNIIHWLWLGLVICLLEAAPAHAFYNPQQGRWINRDPTGDQAEHDLYAFVLNNPIVQVDLLGNATYSWPPDPMSVPMTFGDFKMEYYDSTPEISESCGKAFFTVKFSGAKGPGWIVQHVKVLVTVWDSAGIRVPVTQNISTEYWEAWEVDKNNNIKPTAYDGFGPADEGLGRKGHILAFGWAKYVTSGMDFIRGGWSKTAIIQSHGLWATGIPPEGWQDEGGKYHELDVSFNCCCLKSTPKLQYAFHNP